MTQDTIRKHFLSVLTKTVNRLTSAIARTGHGPFSLIRHVGRRSGRTYETPIILGKVTEGFVAELTYGEKVNWYKNVLAADGCVVLHHRKQYNLTAIEPCDPERGRRAFPLPLRLVLTALRRTEFRVLRTEDA
jgi:deazaflavin-dependent oxidoreductase (nitroreductase family)